MYTCLSHLFLYNDICCSMYVINIMVVMTMMFVELRPKMIRSWLSYEIWNIRSVNKLNVDNLGPPDVGVTKILIKFNMNTLRPPSTRTRARTHTHTHTHTHIWLLYVSVDMRLLLNPRYGNVTLARIFTILTCFLLLIHV